MTRQEYQYQAASVRNKILDEVSILLGKNIIDTIYLKIPPKDFSKVFDILTRFQNKKSVQRLLEVLPMRIEQETVKLMLELVNTIEEVTGKEWDES